MPLKQSEDWNLIKINSKSINIEDYKKQKNVRRRSGSKMSHDMVICATDADLD